MPAMGAGFGYVPFPDVARQMAIAYDKYLHPPIDLDWDVVTARHRRLAYDGDAKIIN